MTSERVVRIIREALLQITPRADGNINKNDLLWALEVAIRQIHEEETAEGIND